MTPASKRRWLRFGLRTVFVVVACTASFFGLLRWARNWAAERQAFLETDSNQRVPMAIVTSDSHSAPLPLRLLGEQGILEMKIGFEGPADAPLGDIYALSAEQKAEVDRIQRLFPEARIEGYVYRVGF